MVEKLASSEIAQSRPNVYVDDEIIRRAHSWLTEMGLRSAEVNLVAVLAEFATAQVREAERDTRERCAQLCDEILLPIDDWNGTKKEFGQKLCTALAERIRGKE